MNKNNNINYQNSRIHQDVWTRTCDLIQHRARIVVLYLMTKRALEILYMQNAHPLTQQVGQKDERFAYTERAHNTLRILYVPFCQVR